jgi:hypothetical protein
MLKISSGLVRLNRKAVPEYNKNLHDYVKKRKEDE